MTGKQTRSGLNKQYNIIRLCLLFIFCLCDRYVSNGWTKKNRTLKLLNLNALNNNYCFEFNNYVNLIKILKNPNNKKSFFVAFLRIKNKIKIPSIVIDMSVSQ